VDEKTEFASPGKKSNSKTKIKVYFEKRSTAAVMASFGMPCSVYIQWPGGDSSGIC
jgi:hypothetical protein